MSPSFHPSFLHSAQFRQPWHFMVSGYEMALFMACSTHPKLANQRGALGHAQRAGSVAHQRQGTRLNASGSIPTPAYSLCPADRPTRQQALTALAASERTRPASGRSYTSLPAYQQRPTGYAHQADRGTASYHRAGLIRENYASSTTASVHIQCRTVRREQWGHLGRSAEQCSASGEDVSDVRQNSTRLT
jgi:hypothetical protein